MAPCKSHLLRLMRTVLTIRAIHLLRKKRLRGQQLGWRNRMYWVRPLNLRRSIKGGEYENQFLEMKEDGDKEKFFKYTRMSAQKFDELLALLKPHLTSTSKRALSAEHGLVITLTYLIEGCTYDKLGTRFQIGESTARGAIIKTCGAIMNVLQPKVLQWPSKEDYYHIMDGFLYCSEAVNDNDEDNAPPYLVESVVY